MRIPIERQILHLDNSDITNEDSIRLDRDVDIKVKYLVMAFEPVKSTFDINSYILDNIYSIDNTVIVILKIIYPIQITDI